MAAGYTDIPNSHPQVFAIDDEFQGNRRISVEDVVMVVQGRQHKNSQESLLLENLAALIHFRKDMRWGLGEVD